MSPQQPWKTKVMAPVKTRLFTIKNLKKCRFWGPMVVAFVPTAPTARQNARNAFASFTSRLSVSRRSSGSGTAGVVFRRGGRPMILQELGFLWFSWGRSNKNLGGNLNKCLIMARICNNYLWIGGLWCACDFLMNVYTIIHMDMH